MKRFATGYLALGVTRPVFGSLALANRFAHFTIMTRSRPSASRRMQHDSAEFKRECRARDEACWLCGRAIAYDEPGSDDSFEIDHYYPVSTHPEFFADPANWRASHQRCNRARGNRAPRAGLGSLSRDW